MKFLIVLFTICLSAIVVSGQYFGGFDRRFSLNAIPNDIYGRDSRQDRGPVVFPPPPPDAPVESSGVIVGASGYGFVPPSQTQFFGGSPQRPFDYFNSRYFRYF